MLEETVSTSHFLSGVAGVDVAHQGAVDQHVVVGDPIGAKAPGHARPGGGEGALDGDRPGGGGEGGGGDQQHTQHERHRSGGEAAHGEQREHAHGGAGDQQRR